MMAETLYTYEDKSQRATLPERLSLRLFRRVFNVPFGDPGTVIPDVGDTGDADKLGITGSGITTPRVWEKPQKVPTAKSDQNRGRWRVTILYYQVIAYA